MGPSNRIHAVEPDGEDPLGFLSTAGWHAPYERRSLGNYPSGGRDAVELRMPREPPSGGFGLSDPAQRLLLVFGVRALRDLDDWTQAELVRRKTEACVVGVALGSEEAERGIAPSVVDADGERVERFEPGLIAYARGGKDIKFNQPAATVGGPEWLRMRLHIVAASFRMPYELRTGNLSQVNYSSIRAGLVELRRLIDALQWQLFIPGFCQPLWNWFTGQAWAAGLLPHPKPAVEWSPPRFEAVQPAQGRHGDLLAMRSATMTLAHS